MIHAYRRFSLPALGLTQRPTYGERAYRVIQRGMFSDVNDDGGSGSREVSTPVVSGFRESYVGTEMPAQDLPTAYELESKASVAGWAEVRDGLRAVTETSAMPVGTLCMRCKSTALFRCQRCGPLGFFCMECFKEYHSVINLFHVAEKWR